MNDLIIVIDQRDTRLQQAGRSIRMYRADGHSEYLPLQPLGLLIIHGDINVSTGVWRLLAENNIPAVILPGRGKGEPAYLGAGLNSAVNLRMAQYQQATDPTKQINIARRIIFGKLNATLALLQVRNEQNSKTYQRLQNAQQQLANVENHEQLMGLEGSAAAAWFTHIATILDKKWRFDGRNRQPPRDPLNSLLSLGYTLIQAEMQGAIQAMGFDPSLGFLHQTYPARPTLSLDLIEALRPSVDAFSLQLLDACFTPEDFFYSQTDGCRLNKQTRGLYYQAYAEARQNWPSYPAVEAINDHSLRGQCRRQTQWLRQQLLEINDG